MIKLVGERWTDKQGRYWMSVEVRSNHTIHLGSIPSTHLSPSVKGVIRRAYEAGRQDVMRDLIATLPEVSHEWGEE